MLEKIVQTDQYTIVTAIIENGVDCLDTSTGELKLGDKARTVRRQIAATGRELLLESSLSDVSNKMTQVILQVQAENAERKKQAAVDCSTYKGAREKNACEANQRMEQMKEASVPVCHFHLPDLKGKKVEFGSHLDIYYCLERNARTGSSYNGVDEINRLVSLRFADTKRDDRGITDGVYEVTAEIGPYLGLTATPISGVDANLIDVLPTCGTIVDDQK